MKRWALDGPVHRPMLFPAPASNVAAPVTFNTPLSVIAPDVLTPSVPLTVDFFNGRYHLPQEAPSGLAFILLQALAVTFYAASAWALRRRFFAHAASWLSFFPYTLAWIVFDSAFAQVAQPRFSWIWTGWAAVLLVVGFVLDRERKVRYAHGPYLAGYVLAGFALARSAPDRSPDGNGGSPCCSGSRH